MPPLLKAASYLRVMLRMEAFMATAQFVTPFLPKDNNKSSSNYQNLKKKFFEARMQKWREKEVNDDVHKHLSFSYLQNVKEK